MGLDRVISCVPTMHALDMESLVFDAHAVLALFRLGLHAIR
jgi:hypothetical protein